MSYSLTPFLLQLAELRRVPGNKNADLLRAAKQSDPARMEYPDDEGLSLGQALEQIVNGAPLDKRYGYIYGYALEQICRHLGETVDADEISDLHMFPRDEIVPWLESSGPPIKLPKIDDFPLIGFVEAAKLPPLLADLPKLYDSLDPELVPSCEALENLYQQAIDHKKDIVGFYY